MTSTLLSIEEAATLLAVPVRTLRYWRETGEGPIAARFGRRLVYRQTDVVAWAEARFSEAELERGIG